MKTSTKVAGFVLGLAAVFTLAVGAGALVGPENTTPDTPGDGVVPERDASVAGGSPAGLTATDNGYTFALDTADVDAGTQVPVHFHILDSDGQPVTRYIESHDKQLHLIAVRRDLTEYAHVHPVLDDTGTWTVPLDLDEAGTYRLFADFTPEGGKPLTLGADLQVAGHFDPRPLPPPTATTTVDGYTVTLDGVLVPDQASTMTATVLRDEHPVTDLQPYLGAYGHLVALRATDLGYLHVHPNGHPGDGITPAGPGIDFSVTTPSAGDYRLFLDFRHDGVVRTAEFTLTAGPAPSTGTDTTPAPDRHGH
ncbi:hypothetical protein EV641_11840 [Rhodococcus sp. SMB37]|uniref:hypothetical protein n=1 Tax=Rhodococcus sp. SMB37 TaxID=2512213 RepID=UPI0006CF5084|nr:hypothetical protein [Rhodococcus sp. SMB37]TCN48117.1 hypothetical protein EV641_11840 [Rhodococcus sp. SMB37]